MRLLVLSFLLCATVPAQYRRPAGDPVYDPKANPESDLKKALDQAKKEHKNVLVDVGGEWCVWCHRMDAFFVDNPELLAIRQQNFIFIKVHFSDEVKNEAFLDKLPQIPGYPHLFVFDASGKLLVSQDSSELEDGKSYNLGKFIDFLHRWSPQL